MRIPCGGLIGIVAVLVIAPLAAGGDTSPLPTPSNPSDDLKRFTVLKDFGDAAVLDQTTGLVWEQSPQTAKATWLDAQSVCSVKTVGGRTGWRLPTLQELLSLGDPTQAHPALPHGHPFGNVQSSLYWSATTVAVELSYAWSVDFANGLVKEGVFGPKTNALHVWCVHGGQGADPGGSGRP